MHCVRALSIAAWLAIAPASVQAVDPPLAAAPAAPPPIAGNRASDYVGQDVTIEGRVAAVHESPLATVLAFSQNFAGFTATILAADRDKFPSDLAARIRDHVVRVSGTVTAYRGKPEMALRDPTQLVLAPAPAPGSVSAARPTPAPATADPAVEELRRVLGRLEARLESIEARLTVLEQTPSEPDEVPPAR